MVTFCNLQASHLNPMRTISMKVGVHLHRIARNQPIGPEAPLACVAGVKEKFVSVYISTLKLQ